VYLNFVLCTCQNCYETIRTPTAICFINRAGAGRSVLFLAPLVLWSCRYRSSCRYHLAKYKVQSALHWYRRGSTRRATAGHYCDKTLCTLHMPELLRNDSHTYRNLFFSSSRCGSLGAPPRTTRFVELSLSIFLQVSPSKVQRTKCIPLLPSRQHQACSRRTLFRQDVQHSAFIKSERTFS